jgi:hypothetical protein
MKEVKRPPASAEMLMPHRYTTKELGELFLKERFQGDMTFFENSQKQAGVNLQLILGKMFPEKTEYSKSDRTEIIGRIAKGELSFGYMAYVLQEDHPIVRGWSEIDKRFTLRQCLNKKISAFQKHLSEVKSGKLISYGDESTPESIEREMTPYQNFRDRLSQRK